VAKDIPVPFLGKKTILLKALQKLGESWDLDPAFLCQLQSLLPEQLKAAPAFTTWDHELRHDYGKPYGIGANRERGVEGTDQLPLVRLLLRGLHKLHRFLSEEDLKTYTANLRLKDTHHEYFAELDPVLRAKELKNIAYEPSLLGNGLPSRTGESTSLTEVPTTLR
jgi:hypothetical protein